MYVSPSLFSFHHHPYSLYPSLSHTVCRHSRIMPLYGKHPFIEEGTYVAPNASVIGDVDVGEKSVVWYGAVLRGDVNSIKVGDCTSIGDRVVVHVAKENPRGPLPTVVGNHVVVEQGSILHACTLEDECFVCTPPSSLSAPPTS